MPATATTTNAAPASSYLEAEILCGVLSDMGMEPAILFGASPTDRVVFFVEPAKAGPGALDIARQIVSRFSDDEEFRENVVHAVSNFGHLLAQTPGIFADLKTCPAATLIAEVVKAGWGLSMRFGARECREPMLSFMPVGDRQAPNSHLLLALLSKRFVEERGSSNGFSANVIEYALMDHSARHRAA